ncbi:MAG: hybrid sensor histidine kinase/response regulator [bacterium]|nr:hybrid sensor histidine kinase/response regulator [bacterium]
MMNQTTIFIVDDTPANLGVLFDHLEAVGFKVLVDTNGESALNAIPQVQPAIILLDIMMPGIDGFETCRRLKLSEATREIPVIFMTALTDTVDKVKGLKIGAVDYITKPFQGEEVVARLKVHLTIRKLRQELQEQNTVLETYAALVEEKNRELHEKNIQLDETNAELDEKNRQLQESNAGKDKFFSIIAHDLRGPVSSLDDMTRLLSGNLESYGPDKLREFIRIEQKATTNLAKLLENLLTWSRMQRGMLEYHPQQILLGNTILRNIDLFSAMANQKDLTLRNSVPDDVSVYGDLKMVDTIVRNLIANALKFTHPGGSINVSARHHEARVEISVTDTGIGISAENTPKLFRIDTRFKHLGTAREKGTGLGLILCKEFVERHHGEIWLESEVGKGTTFTFTLPAYP